MMVEMVSVENLDLLELVDHKDILDHLEMKVEMAMMEYLALPENKDQEGCPVLREMLECLGNLDQKDLVDHLDNQDHVALRDQQEKKGLKVLQDQKLGVWSIPDGEESPVLKLQEHKNFILEKLQEMIIVTLEVELITYVYLISLSFI